MVLRNPKRTQPREVINEVLRTLHLFAVLREKTNCEKANADFAGLYRNTAAPLKIFITFE